MLRLTTLSLILAASAVPTYATIHKLLVSGAATGGVTALTFNDVASTLTLGVTSLTQGASWITLTPNAQRAYLTFRTDTSAVGAFNVDASTGALTPLGSQVTTPVPVFVGLNHEQTLLFTASYPGGSISTVKLSGGAAVGTAVTQTFTATAPLASPQDQSRPHSVIVDTTGSYAIFPDDGLDLLHVYKIGTTGITLLYNLPSPKRPSGPRHAVLSGKPVVSGWAPRLHVLNEVDNSVETWLMHYSASNVTMTLQGAAQSTLVTPAGQDVSTAAELLISPNGKFILASNRNTIATADGSIAVFKLNAPTAATAMSRISISTSGGINPRSMALDKTGKWLAVVNGVSNNIAIFSFDQTTGALGTYPVTTLSGIVVPQTVVWQETYTVPTASAGSLAKRGSQGGMLNF